MKAVDLFEPYFFWDCVVEEIDLKDDAEFIIERILARSFDEDREDNINKLLSIYAIEKIRTVAKNSTQIFGNNKIEKFSKIIGISPTEVKTYIKCLD